MVKIITQYAYRPNGVAPYDGAKRHDTFALTKSLSGRYKVSSIARGVNTFEHTGWWHDPNSPHLTKFRLEIVYE